MTDTSVSIYHQAIGDQWDRLDPIVRRHYDLKAGEKLESEGWLHVHHAWMLTPILRVTALFGLLFPEQADRVRTTLINEAAIDTHGHPVVAWRRCLYFKQPDGSERPRRFDSVVKLVSRGGNQLLLEKVALNQAVAMRMRVSETGALVYESAGFYAVFGEILIPVPAPSRIFIREWAHPTDPDRFCMAFHLTAPLFGNVFGYEGEFRITK